MDVSVIVVNWNTRELLATCLDSLDRTAGALSREVIVVDNGSTDGSQAMVRQHFPQVQLVANRQNLGFARANNQAASLSRGRYLLLLNSDAQLLPGALQALLRLGALRPTAGAIGPRLLNPDRTFQASYMSFPGLGREFLILSGLGRLLYGQQYPSHGPEVERGPRPVHYVEGASMLVRRQAWEDAGGLDEGYFMYAEDVEFCYALRKRGWEIWYQPEAQVVHLKGASSRHRRPQREADLYRSRVRFFRKHYGSTAAELLKLEIYGFTALKIAFHSLLRAASRGRYGRPVVGVRELIVQLREGV